MSIVSAADWDRFLSLYPQIHILQTSAWGELKGEFGWEAIRVVAGENGAQVLFRRLPLGFSFAYLPKGPVGENWDCLWPELDSICRQRRSVFLKVEPDLEASHPEDGQKTPPGFELSRQPVQPVRTLVVDLQGSEDQILSRMKQKTRYNIRLALKRGVVVRPDADVDTFYRLMEVTGRRDQFGVHSREYYQRAYELFYPRGQCELFVAEAGGEPLAGLMVFAHGRRAWYFYGASSSTHRDYMATYLIQWEAMRWARGRGCTEYDLWGVPDADEEVLEANFTSRSDGLWGVYRFKRGFGGELRRSAGPWDRVYQPALYWLYRRWVARG